MGLLLGCGNAASQPTAGGAGSDRAISITGAGSTFVYPAMVKWTYAYHDSYPNITINYQQVGSGAGIGQYKAGTVDFGATDAPLTPNELAAMPTPTAELPVVAGCAVLAYNVAGVGSGLKLSGDVIADMFLGKIKAWNDPRIVSQNSGLKLPAAPITVVHRSDGSGTTFMFTDYLSSVSPDWKSGPGIGKTVNWPIGIGAKGSDGVAGLIRQTDGSVGYVELSYATQTKLKYGPIRNKSGVYVDPGGPGTSAAAEAAADKLANDISTSIVNSGAKGAYPIAGFTYVLVAKKPKDAAKQKAIKDFLSWALGPGQDLAATLQYAPLPASVAKVGAAALAGQ